jgi:hypothetical protein
MLRAVLLLAALAAYTVSGEVCPEDQVGFSDGVYDKHDTFPVWGVIDLDNPMPCDGVITSFTYRARGTDNNRTWSDDRDFFFFLVSGQSETDPCAFDTTTALKKCFGTQYTKQGIRTRSFPEGKELPVSKGDHFGWYYNHAPDEGGLIAFRWGEKVNGNFIDEDVNYCAGREKPKVGDAFAKYGLGESSNKDSPSHRFYNIQVNYRCSVCCEFPELGAEYVKNTTINSNPSRYFEGPAKYLKHDTWKTMCQVDLKHPMPCDGYIWKVTYQVRGSDNWREWYADEKRSLVLYVVGGFDENDVEGSCSSGKLFTKERRYSGQINQDATVNEWHLNNTSAGMMAVQKGDHFMICWGACHGFVAYDQLENEDANPDTRNYCGMKLGGSLPKANLNPLTGMNEAPPSLWADNAHDSPTHRVYALRVYVVCGDECQYDIPVED